MEPIPFRAGQKVRLINNGFMAALKGATAIIENVNPPFINIKWLTGSNGQIDGSYYPETFEALLEKNQQLLFDFYE